MRLSIYQREEENNAKDKKRNTSSKLLSTLYADTSPALEVVRSKFFSAKQHTFVS